VTAPHASKRERHISGGRQRGTVWTCERAAAPAVCAYFFRPVVAPTAVTSRRDRHRQPRNWQPSEVTAYRPLLASALIQFTGFALGVLSAEAVADAPRP
jgi:hypothetical protein